jgi:hypothetical protein
MGSAIWPIAHRTREASPDLAAASAAVTLAASFDGLEGSGAREVYGTGEAGGTRIGPGAAGGVGAADELGAVVWALARPASETAARTILMVRRLRGVGSDEVSPMTGCLV